MLANMPDFQPFARTVHNRLKNMSQGELFVIDVGNIFESYLAAFPEGTNPIFRERTHYDCSCCKSFIRNFGRVVSIENNRVCTVWDDWEGLEYPFNVVSQKMAELVRQAPIQGVFRSKETRYGLEHNIEVTPSGETLNWHHFHGVVPRHHHNLRPEESAGKLNTMAKVLLRGLKELKVEAVQDVIDMIDANVLYRGGDFLDGLKAFKALQKEYIDSGYSSLMAWKNSDSPAARFRNTAMGTLVQDLSEGVDTEKAVRSYEVKVAPANYSRPKSLITPRMIDDALKTLESLGLADSVHRRFAVVEDLKVTDVLFVDNSVRGKMKGGLRDALMSAAAPSAKPDKGTPIGVEEFVRSVVPNSTAISLYLEGDHLSKLFSLTAPVHPDSGRLFKWDNGFAWTYAGDVTDSIKERVKKAGGNTNADFRVSLSWDNLDDLDLHCRIGTSHIYYGNKQGILDVDMNVFNPIRGAVENLSWIKPRDGTYLIGVDRYSTREADKLGYVLEVENKGEIRQFSSRTSPHKSGGFGDECLKITVKSGVVTEISVATHMTGASVSVEKWGVKTKTPVKVNTLFMSPNHWDDSNKSGAKHWFFALEGCQNPDEARGIYNEFLRGDLVAHRKVFEVLGAKTKCPNASNQLSGVGFTAGRGDSVLVTVDSATGRRSYEVSF